MICRACLWGRSELVFAMEPMPLAGAFAETAEAAIGAIRYPLEWHRCLDCGLVNVAPDIPDADLYAHYSYRASDVPALVRHHRDFAVWLAQRFRPRLHIEIGGNDGVLTRQLPWPSVNVDPSDAAAAGAVRAPFTTALVNAMGWTGRADLVTSSNAFAHFTDLSDALTGVRLALAREGRFVVEVHDLFATLATAQWDTVYHEHKVEWSLGSLVAAGALHGLRHLGHERLTLHGGLLRVVFGPDLPRRQTPPPRPDFAPLRRAYLARASMPLPIGAVAYGAAARAVVYLNQVRPAVRYIVDASPRRHGRYVPGTGTPVVPPETFDADDPPACLITAWNHREDIERRHPAYTRWVTAW